MWKPGCSRCKGSFQQVPAERRKDAGMRRKNVQGRRPYLQRRYLSPVIVPKPKWGDPVLFFVFFDYLRVAWGDGIFQNDFPDRVGSDPAGRGIFH